MRSFLQTEEWLEFQKSVGHPGWRFDNGKIRANILRYDIPFRKNYLYIPHGPEIDFNAIIGTVGHQLDQFVVYIKNLAREQKSMFVKIEPLDGKVSEAFHQFKFKKSKKELQPRRTVIMDLEKSEEELLSAMHHKTRYNIKVAERSGITVKPTDDVNAFWRLMQHTSKRDRFSSHPKSYYEKLVGLNGPLKTHLVLARSGDQPVAGTIVLVHGDTGYYLHGVSDHEHRAMMAPYALHWDIMRQLKKSGVKHYDFWGIDANKWPGVTRFKLGWGGRQIEYPGSFDLRTSKFWAFAYRVLQKIR